MRARVCGAQYVQQVKFNEGTNNKHSMETLDTHHSSHVTWFTRRD